MHTKTTLKFLGASVISLMLAACGGGDGSALDNALNGGSQASSTNSSVNTSAIGVDTLQSLGFKDVSPSSINLKGTGGAESSLVRFRTLGQTGLPIKGITVNFALTSTVGGLALTQASAVSDKDGYVSTSVTSGNVSTSIRVTATTPENPAISAQSSELVIATGLPDQKSMSIALEKFNPDGWNTIGVTSKVSVLLADAFNNPAPNGTLVYFTTEGGIIKPSCTTIDGGCNVTWTSGDPRPARNSQDNSLSRILCLGLEGQSQHECEAERAGRSTILATAIGNESFKDTNGNGVYDKDVDVFRTSKDAKCSPNVPRSTFETASDTYACDDLAEAYLDTNENGIKDKDEQITNFITSTKDDLGTDNYTPNNGMYNGALCQEADEVSGKCSRKPISIRKEHVIVMSCDEPLVDENGMLPAVGNGVFAVADCNGNALPVGSTITVGSAEPMTIGNEYNWRPIAALAGTVIKLEIVSGSQKKKISLTVN